MGESLSGTRVYRVATRVRVVLALGCGLWLAAVVGVVFGVLAVTGSVENLVVLAIGVCGSLVIWRGLRPVASLAPSACASACGSCQERGSSCEERRNEEVEARIGQLDATNLARIGRQARYAFVLPWLCSLAAFAAQGLFVVRGEAFMVALVFLASGVFMAIAVAFLTSLEVSSFDEAVGHLP
ncbi:MAG: hypothetical protein ACYDHP_13110 [Ferrimicrobium sp.]